MDPLVICPVHQCVATGLGNGSSLLALFGISGGNSSLSGWYFHHGHAAWRPLYSGGSNRLTIRNQLGVVCMYASAVDGLGFGPALMV